MDDQQVTTTQDEQPVTTPQETVTQDEPITEAAEVTETSSEPSVGQPETIAAPAEVVDDEEEDNDYPTYEVPQVPQLDFNNMPAGDDGLIDPNLLASAINQQVNSAAESARIAARNEYQEQRTEERNWEKAYEKYPELKTNKDLRDLVHRARLGEVTDLLSKTRDPQSIKLPTPGQVAERFFKQIGTAKQEGMKQATENTVIQASAHVESSGTRTSSDAESRTKMFQNINNSNKEVAKQARTELLKSMLFKD